jgi:hypothetical protein
MTVSSPPARLRRGRALRTAEGLGPPARDDLYPGGGEVGLDLVASDVSGQGYPVPDPRRVRPRPQVGVERSVADQYQLGRRVAVGEGQERLQQQVGSLVGDQPPREADHRWLG